MITTFLRKYVGFMIDSFVDLCLSPDGRLYFSFSSEEHLLPFKTVQSFIDKPEPLAILHLGMLAMGTLPTHVQFWRDFARGLVIQACKLGPLEDLPSLAPPSEEALLEMIQRAPFMKGADYLTPEVFFNLWVRLEQAFRDELKAFPGSLQQYLQQYDPQWNLVGRVCFHLAENKRDEARPFAFLATYTTQLSLQSAAQHLPLKRALLDYAGESHREALLALLKPVQRAAETCPFIKELVDSGAVFQALPWSVHEAHRFLQEIPTMEASGIVVRVPNWWSSSSRPRLKVHVHLGDQPTSQLGLNALMDFHVSLALGNGEKLTMAEWQEIQATSGNFIKIKGQWVEIDRDQLNAVLSKWEHLKKGARHGISMAEGLRLLASGGAKMTEEVETDVSAEWSSVKAGQWLKSVLDQLKQPREEVDPILETHLKAKLRSYQNKGVQWLWLLYQLKLGGCLADDMGLGKTIQVLSFLLLIRHRAVSKKPHLLIVPASLLGNWLSESAKFAPSLRIYVAHPSFNDCAQGGLKDVDLVLTTYSFVARLDWLQTTQWDVLILDEAQAIKNPGAKQTRAVKTIHSEVRFALTGTPVENRLGDLWSLFDFTSPGLLGSSKIFASFTKRPNHIEVLRSLTQPYILRRLKSDKKIITDLPDKTEMHAHCTLSKEQIRLYSETIKELAEQLEKTEGIHRRGLILSSLMKLKQICNHPAQCLGYGEYAEKSSGKWMRLREICEEISEKQEKVLIFTQFREIIPHLSHFLHQIFGQEGLMLHGDTPIAQRSELVTKFQEPRGAPFFVLSLKAGGTGLTLTRASHVIHFDRWWNPAVENQATDRAYRIGQKNPVLVHKFMCLGTIEEKIDAMISSKKALSQELLEGEGEISLTEMNNEQLLQLVSLDIQRVIT